MSSWSRDNEAFPWLLPGHPFAGRADRWRLVVRWIRASMRTLTIIPLAPRVISRGSAVCRPKIIQQVSSPRMSSHVPEEMPVGRTVRYAVQTEGVTWSRNAAVSSAPRPARPPTAALAGIPEIRHAERLFGDPDYLVRVATASLAAYQALRDEKLAALPGVQRLTSTIVMKRVVEDRPYPT